MNFEYPIPQADNLEAIATVVDAVAGGADSTALIAEAIGMSGRQGSYYPNAAAVLGYIKHGRYYGRWEFTTAGAAFYRASALARAADMCRRIVTLSEDYWLSGDLNETTLARRLQTQNAWARFTSLSVTEQALLVGSAITETRQRTIKVVADEKLRAELSEPPAAPAESGAGMVGHFYVCHDGTEVQYWTRAEGRLVA
jgi:hypothetical protein